MSVPDTLEARSDRCIALLKPSEAVDERVTHALHLLESILWAFQGTMHSTWNVVPVEGADVVVFHEGNTDERIPQWKAQGKPIVEIAIQTRLDSDTPNLLVYPFRPAQVLALLERLETQLTSGLEAPMGAESDLALAPGNLDPWNLVESLRTLRSVENSDAWLVARDARATPILWLRGDAATYTAEPGTIQAIRRGALNPNRLRLQKGSAPTGGQAPRSGMELSWFAGYYASERLAPALKVSTPYKISSWPNFGLIRPLPSQMRVAAGLASAAADLSEIIKRSGASADEATRTLNALHACGVLVAMNPGQQPVDTSATVRQAVVHAPRGGFTKFLINVRKHLGLGTRS